MGARKNASVRRPRSVDGFFFSSFFPIVAEYEIGNYAEGVSR